MARGISLHIGLNSVDPDHYAGWSGELNACEADAVDMQEIAAAHGYTSTVLLTRAATKPAVKAAITSAASELASGDIFFLTYSGHGGQLPDANDDEDDGVDETWCLYDGELIDDTLFELFAKFQAGVRIFVLSDSCHSGSVTREQLDALARAYGDMRRFDASTGAPVGPAFRGMPVDKARLTYFKNRAAYDAELAAADPNAADRVVATVRLISGCQDDQLSSDGVFNGAFTGALKRVWKKGLFIGNYQNFYDAIVARMPKVQKPNHLVYGAANPAFDAERPFKI